MRSVEIEIEIEIEILGTGRRRRGVGRSGGPETLGTRDTGERGIYDDVRGVGSNRPITGDMSKYRGYDAMEVVEKKENSHFSVKAGFTDPPAAF